MVVAALWLRMARATSGSRSHRRSRAAVASCAGTLATQMGERWTMVTRHALAADDGDEAGHPPGMLGRPLGVDERIRPRVGGGRVVS
jgi:hypothetical protein